jgi:hypothetical protein
MNAKTIRRSFLLSLILGTAVAFAAETPSVTEQRFQASIVAVDPVRQTIRVRHKPTGFETDVVWDEKSVVRAQVKYDIDEVPDGWVDCWPGEVDATQKTVSTMHAKVFTRDGQSMAYIWPTRPWDTAFTLTVPAGKSVQYYAAPKGERVDLPPGRQRLVIKQESWARIVGLDYASLHAGLRE